MSRYGIAEWYGEPFAEIGGTAQSTCCQRAR